MSLASSTATHVLLDLDGTISDSALGIGRLGMTIRLLSYIFR